MSTCMVHPATSDHGYAGIAIQAFIRYPSIKYLNFNNFYVWLPWLRFFRAFSSVVGKCQGITRKDGARPALFLIFVLFYVFLCCSMYFCVVICIVRFVSFSLLFLCMCVLNYCHRVATQLQLTNTVYLIIYHTISYHISHHISYHIIYHIIYNISYISYHIIYHI
jgi:fatty acid desaturase